MQQEEFAIGTLTHVDFDDVAALGNGALDGEQAVFGSVAPDAAVSDDGTVPIWVGDEGFEVHV